MRALLWKDYRINRGVVLLGAALLLGPYAAVIFWGVRTHWPSLPSAAEWSGLLATASLLSLVLSQLTLVTLAGNVIASERNDRSAEFLAYLPPSRLQILMSKFTLVLAAAGVVWGVNLAAAELLAPALGGARGNPTDALADRSMVAAVAVTLIGAGWLGSALLESPAMAACLGIGVAFAVPLLVMAGLNLFAPGGDLKQGCLIACPALGVLCFAWGSAYYLRRVEP
jgi:ABC-type transport system involved in multi-copper enzyme maturation permease subunit